MKTIHEDIAVIETLLWSNRYWLVTSLPDSSNKIVAIVVYRHEKRGWWLLDNTGWGSGLSQNRALTAYIRKKAEYFFSIRRLF